MVTLAEASGETKKQNKERNKKRGGMQRAGVVKKGGREQLTNNVPEQTAQRYTSA